MGKYVNGTFVPDENDLLLQQQQKMAGLQSAPQPQQAVSQPAPVTQPNPEVAEFAQAKADNQANNSPRVAGQAGTVYNIFTRPAAEQKQVQQAVQTPAVTTPVNSGTTTPQTKPIRSMDDLANAMGYTSPEEEEKLRKASVANQRIVAVADALRQIGNIYNTTRYAPSQQFNSPVELERQRYLQGKALRDKANQTYISYQQAKVAQDAKQRQWEAQFKYNVAKDARDYALKKNESDARANLNEAKIHRYNTLMELDQARREGIISDNEWRAQRAKLYPELTQSQIARNNRTGTGKSGGGSRGRGGSSMPDYDVDTVYERDEEGRVTKSTKTRRVKHTDGQTSTSTKTTQKKQNPMGSSSSSTTQKNKKKNPMS